jgi:hypothetical protein
MQKTITVSVCDTCEDSTKPASTYTVAAKEGKSVEVDLCAKHSRPLEVLLGNAKPAGRPAAQKRASRVTSVEKIEAGKTARKRS